MNKNSKIYVAGHRGLVGSAIIKSLEKEGFTNLIYRTSSELDLRKQFEVEAFFNKEKPEYVFLAAAYVGGIQANNNFPAKFIYNNLMIQTNIIEAAYRSGTVKKLMFLGSSCIYPKFAEQPIKEEYLLGGPLEPTNEPYAIAKIAGLKMCSSYNREYGTNFISVMPTNLYGPNDNFDLENSHVLPALIRKVHEAKKNNNNIVEIWGSGTPRREFLYVDDLADACLYLMKNVDAHQIGECINIGTGIDVTIRELVEIIKEVIGYEGETIYNTQKPDGTPRKLLNISLIEKLGWRASTSLKEGIKQTYSWYIQNEG
ncbi:GDP-L-fucose synthase family protein [Paenibacillus piri]|uniref:GDP-L-fucose synthase n=1 Tax=Paenibacillus piri TaxID=2547395 RepID=A0A4R5KKW9_9BACL|nr:GDP-L-fucose synthase [Paenibacillus piri]TDF96211.1 GDP-L-fucose synthase [Paenibacillus piri]